MTSYEYVDRPVGEHVAEAYRRSTGQACRPAKCGTVALLDGEITDVVACAPALGFGTAWVSVTARLSAWTPRVMWNLREARVIQTRLAVAEERLRFGRDMHDVLGRNLAVIALKSELAVQPAQRGRPEAVDRMVEVQRIARESQQEIRELVRGYRAPTSASNSRAPGAC